MGIPHHGINAGGLHRHSDRRRLTSGLVAIQGSRPSRSGFSGNLDDIPHHGTEAGMKWNHKQTKATIGTDEATFTVYSDEEGRGIARHIRTEKDARLIAAAPDLLEACKEMLAILRNQPLSQAEFDRWSYAITKAE